MKGLYLNIEGAEQHVIGFATSVGAPTSIEQALSPRGNQILVDNHRQNWPEGAIVSLAGGELVAASGHFIYKNQLGNLHQFAEDFISQSSHSGRMGVCAAIESGSFVIYVETTEDCYLITDPFGLHPHYQDRAGDGLKVAPAASLIAPGRDTLPLATQILKKKRHLFGNLTIWKQVERLEPGAIVSPLSTQFYFNYFPPEGPAQRSAETVRPKMIDNFKHYRGRAKLLPISGGLDSRFLLSVAKMDYGYTYGPSDLGDRPVARQFSKYFSEYREFSLLELCYPKHVFEQGERLFFGTIHKPLSELLVLYGQLAKQWGAGVYFCDGYLGDALQRGIYFNVNGWRGLLFRLCPWLLFRMLSPKQLLMQRYSDLNEEETRLLLETYEATMARFQCDEWQKVFLFEALYGRGARFIVHGGSVMANQFFTPLQPFAFYDVFRSFMAEDVRRFASFRLLKPLWRESARDFRAAATVDFYRPKWPSFINRFLHVAARAMEKTANANRINSYKEELNFIRWK